MSSKRKHKRECPFKSKDGTPAEEGVKIFEYKGLGRYVRRERQRVEF